MTTLAARYYRGRVPGQGGFFTVCAGTTETQDQELQRHDAMTLAAVDVCNDEVHVMIAT